MIYIEKCKIVLVISIPSYIYPLPNHCSRLIIPLPNATVRKDAHHRSSSSRPAPLPPPATCIGQLQTAPFEGNSRGKTTGPDLRPSARFRRLAFGPTTTTTTTTTTEIATEPGASCPMHSTCIPPRYNAVCDTIRRMCMCVRVPVFPVQRIGQGENKVSSRNVGRHNALSRSGQYRLPLRMHFQPPVHRS